MSVPSEARRRVLREKGHTFTERLKQAVLDGKPVKEIVWRFEKPPVVASEDM